MSGILKHVGKVRQLTTVNVLRANLDWHLLNGHLYPSSAAFLNVVMIKVFESYKYSHQRGMKDTEPFILASFYSSAVRELCQLKTLPCQPMIKKSRPGCPWR